MKKYLVALRQIESRILPSHFNNHKVQMSNKDMKSNNHLIERRHRDLLLLYQNYIVAMA